MPSYLSTLPQGDSALHNILPKSCIRTKAKPASIIIPKSLLEGSKRENIVRCLDLLDHLTDCSRGNECTEGEGCRRTKQVIYHHFSCPDKKNCSICDQLINLCYLHRQCCDRGPGECEVPLCPNIRNPQNRLSPKIEMDEEASMEDTKEVVKLLQLALKKSSVVEKREEISKLLKRYPVAATKILRGIYNVRMNKIRQAQGKSLATPEKSVNEWHTMRGSVAHSRPVPNLYVANFKLFPVVKEEGMP